MSIKLFNRSLDKILELSPSVIYPGHGPVIQDPIPKIKYYIKHRMERENQILDCVSSAEPEGLSPMEIVAKVYKDTPEKLWRAAEVNVVHHLDKLDKEKKVVQVNGKWFVTE